MTRPLTRAALSAALLALPVFVFTQAGQSDTVSARARQIHDRAIVIDSHDDTTQRLLSDKTFDIGTRQKNGNIDIPRMREGGLDGLFFSIWVPSDVTGMKAVNTANALIASVHKAVAAHPNDLMLATTAADIRREYLTKKSCAPYCTISCVHQTSIVDRWRDPQVFDFSSPPKSLISIEPAGPA